MKSSKGVLSPAQAHLLSLLLPSRTASLPQDVSTQTSLSFETSSSIRNELLLYLEEQGMLDEQEQQGDKDGDKDGEVRSYVRGVGEMSIEELRAVSTACLCWFRSSVMRAKISLLDEGQLCRRTNRLLTNLSFPAHLASFLLPLGFCSCTTPTFWIPILMLLSSLESPPPSSDGPLRVPKLSRPSNIVAHLFNLCLATPSPSPSTPTLTPTARLQMIMAGTPTTRATSTQTGASTRERKVSRVASRSRQPHPFQP